MRSIDAVITADYDHKVIAGRPGGRREFGDSRDIAVDVP
jgi:hypothetical protein